MNGFLVVDKPAGMTSHSVVNRVRRLTGEKKAGHTGTLDPFATGVLPVALGEATKAIRFLDESIKTYRAVMRLGVVTDTQDCTGHVLEEFDWHHVTDSALATLADRFLGPQCQVPPMFSAVKQNGVPLYRLARHGVEVERQARQIEIFSLHIEQVNLPDVTFVVSCSRGTYVRTLAHDMGKEAGCGAHLVELRRLRSGSFTETEAVSLDRLAEMVSQASFAEQLIAPREALAQLKELTLPASTARKVANGVMPGIDELTIDTEMPTPGERFKLVYENRLLSVAEWPDRAEGATLRLLRVFN